MNFEASHPQYIKNGPVPGVKVLRNRGAGEGWVKSGGEVGLEGAGRWGLGDGIQFFSTALPGFGTARMGWGEGGGG